jgi:hypothetical protein
VNLTLTLADSVSVSARLPVEIWYLGNHYVDARPITGELVRVEIDAQHGIPDVRRENNVWMKPQ